MNSPCSKCSYIYGCFCFLWQSGYHVTVKFFKVMLFLFDLYFRWGKHASWQMSHADTDFAWKRIAEPVMKSYMEATDGSSVETKESALVWHYRDADPDFGSWQAMELLDHLENVLANEPVAVKKGQHIIEVKPQVLSVFITSHLKLLFISKSNIG